MGRYLSWRKALTASLLLTCVYINSEPLIGKNHRSNILKNNSIKKSYSISKNSYKEIKTYSFVLEDKGPIERQFKKASVEHWGKYLTNTYNRLIPYRDFIAQEIEKQDVPYELLYLPIIESGARPMARSHMGATGLWQFMSNSSGAYDMKTNEWVDERRDFVKSTRGAISKLKYNYNATGDWLLALAAYNCGLGRVKNIMRRTGVTDYWEMSEQRLLPRETINYVPKFLLVSYLMQNKNSYNVPIKWEEMSWSEVKLEGAVDLRLLSKTAGIPFHILKSGNSELNYNVTPPTNINYKLKVPGKYTDSVINALKNQEQLIEFYRYKIKSGDTLSEIGYHYGLSTYGLLRYNPGVSAKNLRIGKTLIIPAVKKVKPYGSLKSKRPFKNNYTVKEGDTLWDISIKFGTTPEEIAINSGLNVNGYIKKGMRLKVP